MPKKRLGKRRPSRERSSASSSIALLTEIDVNGKTSASIE